MAAMDFSLSDVARLVGGELNGDGQIRITGADTIRDARRGEITFIADPKLADRLAACQAVAALVPRDLRPDTIPFITVDDVQEAFAKVVAHFRPPREDDRVGVSATAIVSPTAKLGSRVTVSANAVIGEGVEIGDGSTIHSGVQVMAGCELGEDVVVFPNVVLYENTVVGSRVIMHAGAVIGAYGFGYNTVDGRHRLSAQLGNVVIGDDVEIGACTTIDRGTYGATLIGEGTKIDNQVMIAHNCRIGRHNMICSQVGVAGSTSTGDYVVMAGQVGIRDHVHIGDGATLGAKAGVMNDIPSGAAYLGIPATPERQQMLMQASLMRLPELKKQIKALQRAIDSREDDPEALSSQEAA
jgi:UDP-3-O-[3-hydroxymyristoyl] glucosamine N-acyltransferase